MEAMPLRVTACGDEHCAPAHSYGPATRPYYLIHFVHSGKGAYYAPEKPYFLAAGQGFIIFPGAVTTYTADESEPWHYSWLGYSGEAAERLTRAAGLTAESPVFAAQRPERLARILADIREDVASLRAGDMGALGGLLRFFAELCEGAAQPGGQAAGANPYYQKAIWFIEGNLPGGVKVAEVAAFVGLCRSQLYRVFMEETGLSPQDWIAQAKTRRAQALLRTTELKLSAVALSSGFASAEQLCHAFRRQGCPPPSEYRQRERQRTVGGGCEF